MSNLEILKKLEKFDSLFGKAKEVSILLGASEEPFEESDKKWEEIKKIVLSKVSGGFVKNESEEEFIIPKKLVK